MAFNNSPLVDFRRISPHRNSPRTLSFANVRQLKFTWHHFAGRLSVETVGQIVQTRQASYNYGIGFDGRIGQYVDDRDRSWASSSRENDHMAITIGLSNETLGPNWTVSDLVIDRAIALTVERCKNYGIKSIRFDGTPRGTFTSHDMFVATLCPGPFLSRRRQEFVDRINHLLNIEEEDVMTQEQRYQEFIEFTARRRQELANLPESGWSQQEGWWELLTKPVEEGGLGIINTNTPHLDITREEFVAVLGRAGLISKP